MGKQVMVLVGVVLVAVLIVQPGRAQTERTDGRSLRFVAEFTLSAGTEGSVSTLRVTFYGERPGPQEAEEVVRRCLGAAVAIHPTSDIVAQAGYSPSPSSKSQEPVELNGGPGGLRYSAKDQSIRAEAGVGGAGPAAEAKTQDRGQVISVLEDKRVSKKCKDVPADRVESLAAVAMDNSGAERKHIVKAMRGWCKDNDVVTDRNLSSCISAISKAAKAMGNSTGMPPADLPAAIARGANVYKVAMCAKCHLANGRGGLRGPDLTDSQWLHCDGSIAGIRKVLVAGVPRTKLKDTSRPFGMNPATNLITDDQQITDLAVYTQSLSNQ